MHTSDDIWYFSVPDFTNLVFFKWFGIKNFADWYLLFGIFFLKKFFTVWYLKFLNIFNKIRNLVYFAQNLVFSLEDNLASLLHTLD